MGTEGEEWGRARTGERTCAMIDVIMRAVLIITGVPTFVLLVWFVGLLWYTAYGLIFG